MLARTRKMANLVIEETSGVDHPAHLHEGWLVMKSADESEVQRVLDESLTEEEIMSDNTQTEVTPAATDEQVEAPTTEATAEVEKAEMTMEEAMKKIADLQAKLVELEADIQDALVDCLEAEHVGVAQYKSVKIDALTVVKVEDE